MLFRRGVTPLGATGSQRMSVMTCVAATPTVPKTTFKHQTALEFAPIVNDKLDAHADAGFTTFDTADIYGPSEKILGDFMKIREAKGKGPVQLFTKYCPNIYNQKVTPAAVEAAVRKSLAAMQVDQLDLVQLHWWDYNIAGMVSVTQALADCQAKGLIKGVATTNMDCQAIEAILKGGVTLEANQVQFSLLDRRPLNGMLQLCQQNGIKLLTYGSLGGGLLSDKYVVEAPKTGIFGGARYPNVDLNTSSLKMYWNITRMFGGQELWRDLLRVLRSVADRHGPDVTVANVALAWVMQQGRTQGDEHQDVLVHPIVGLRGVSHIADNARALSLRLSSDDLGQIDEVLSKAQGPQGDIYSFERGN